MLMESMRINPCGSARVMKPLNEASHSGEGGPAICTDTYKTMNIYTEIEGARTPFSRWLELLLTWIMAANQSKAVSWII